MEENQETYQDTPTQEEPPIKRLYDGLYKTKRYTKSFDEFKTQYSSQEAIDKLYTGLEKSQSYTKGKDEFYKQYFNDVKRKEEPIVLLPSDGKLPLQKQDKVEGLVDANVQPQEPIVAEKVEPPIILGNVFDDANKSFSLRNTTKEISNNDLRNNAPITLIAPDEEAVKKSKEIDKQYLENGIDPQKVATLTQGLNFTQEQKDNLDYVAKTNPAYFNRHLQHISWTAPFMQELQKKRQEAKLENDPQKAAQIERAVSDVYKNGKILPYEQAREVTRNALRGIRTIFDKPEEQQNKFAENAEYNYGQQLIPIKQDGVWYEPNAEVNRGKDVAKMFDSGINHVQRIGLNYLEDLHPEQYQSYKGLLVPYKEGDENNMDLQVGKQEKLMRLEALGLNIKYKAALEEFYKAIENGDVEAQNTYKEVLDNTQKFSENLIEKYPLVKQLDAEKLAMEVNGRDDLPTTRFMYVLGSAIDKTLKGGWEIISYPFRSEENYQKHLLEVVGDTKQNENITYLPQKYQTIQSFDTEQSDEAKAKFAEINAQDISDEEKNKQIADYIAQNKDAVKRKGIDGGRTNITMASMLYGVSDIAANLAPYVALTALTGGGASASALRAFSSEFSAASLTMFNDELSAAAERGEANPFASALRHTFINSAAMAGAGTAGKIRELAMGSKNPAIKAMIANMDDKAIEAAIKKETQSRFKNIYEVAKNKMVQSATTAAKITPAIQLGGVVNDAMDGKEFDAKEQVKHLGVETFKFTVFGLLTGGIGAIAKREKPNDVQKYSMLEAGKNSDYFIKNIDTQLQEGKINTEQHNVLKSNIEIAKKVYDNTPMVDANGKPLSDKKKRDLTFIKFNEVRAAELLKKDIPQKLREKTELELQAAKEEAEKIQSGKEPTFEDKFRETFPIFKNSTNKEINETAKENATDDPVQFIKAFGEEKFNELVKDMPIEDLQSKLDTLIKGNADNKGVDILDKIIAEKEVNSTEMPNNSKGELENISQPIELSVETPTQESSTRVEEGSGGVEGDVESTAKALEDKFYGNNNRGNAKVEQLQLIDLIPKEVVDNPELNGFYKTTKYSKEEVSNLPKIQQERISKLQETYKDKYKENIIAEAYHKAKSDGSNPKLVKAVENLLGKEQPKAETPKVENEKEPIQKTDEGVTGSNEPIATEKASVAKEGVGENLQGEGGGKEPPKVDPPKNEFLYSPNEERRTSGLMKHLLEAENVDENVKQGIKDKGLDKYEVANNAEARVVASQMVNSLGKNDALQVARMEDMHPSVRSAIYAEIIDNAFKLEQEAIKSGDKEAQMEAAAEWASVSKEYDKKLTAGGQFTAYAAHFYKQSPLGFVLKSNEQIAKKFEDYVKDKDTDLQEVFKLITETEGGKDLLNKKVEELRKEERKVERKKRDKKIDEFFDGLKAKGDILYSAPIPPSVWNGAMDILKTATKGGDRVVEMVQAAIEHITKNIGDDWDKERFRKEYEQKINDIADGGAKEKSYEQVLRDRATELKRRLTENDFSAEEYKDKKDLSEKEKAALEDLKQIKEEYDNAKKKSTQYIDKKSKQYLDMVRGRLKNMNEKQKEDFIRRISKKLIENGALRYDEFKKELADVMGFKELTPEQITRAEELTKQINGLEDIENAMVEKKTVQSKLDYIESQNKAAEAQNELFNMVARKTDLMSTFKSWYTGSLMGVQSLFVNTVFNPIQQLTVRMPKAVLLNIGEQGGKVLSKAMHKLTGSPLYNPKLNILDAQKGYFGSFSPAIKNAWFNFKKGVENRDLFGKNEYQTSLSPRLAKEELAKFRRGEIYLTPMEVIDRKVRKSIFARQADFILRGMQFGDVVPRWMAEGAKSIQIAKNELGITDPVELDIFMYSPEKMAKQILLKQGKSEIQASKLAAEIKERIVFEGEKAVMQEGNLLKSISSATDKGLAISEKDELGMRAAKTVGSTVKTLTFPFIGIPANLAWQGFKLVNPEISLGLSISQTAQSLAKAKKGDMAGSKKYFEMAKDNFAHSVLGLTYLSAAAFLVNAGLTRSSNDEDTKVKERAGESTYGKQNQFNMGKAMGGEDFWVDNKFLGLFGTMLDVKSKQKDEALKKKLNTGEEGDMSWVDDFSERIGYGGIAQLNNLVFNNGSKVVSAISGGDAPFRMWMNQTTNGLSSLFTGGTYTSFSKAILPEQVAVKGDGIVSEIINSQKQRNVLLRLGIDMFGGNGTPPSKISIWGEPIKNDRSVSGILGNMLGWEKGSNDVFGAIIYDDYRRTGNAKFFPMPEDAKFSVGGKQVELNKEQKKDLDILVGQARKTFVKAIVYDLSVQYGDKKYSEITDDKEKIEFLNTAYDAAKKIGYNKFIEKYPQFDKVEKTEDEVMNEKETKSKNKALSNEIKNIEQK